LVKSQKYQVFSVGFTTTVEPVVGEIAVGGLQKYDSAPETVIVALSPKHKFTKLGIIGVGGLKKTCTTTSSVKLHPLGAVISTVYVVVSVGVAMGVALVGLSKLPAGDHK
jgi:hypothetical protein